MAGQELAIFGNAELTEKELGEIEGISHSALLEQAFHDLTGELDENGNTEVFGELREKYGRKLITFWQQKRILFEKAVKESRTKAGEEFVNGSERLLVIELGVYERDDEIVLQINRKTDTEEDEVSITVSTERGLDEFLRPPTIKSKIRTEPTEAPDIYYEVVFRNGKISTFERLIYREDQDHIRPYIKDVRIIDCSIFGVEV